MKKQSSILHYSLCIVHCALCILCCASAHGAAVDAMTDPPSVMVSSLAARQRTPWNGKVDIDFSFVCDNPDAFAFIQFKATYIDKNGATNDVPMKTFDQITFPWCTNAGIYRVTWDSAVDVPGLQVENLTYTVTANMAKYMVVDLSKGTSATADDPYPITYMEECPDPTRTDGGWTDEYRTTKMVFRLVQPGTYKKGWNINAFPNWHCHPAYNVTITRPFYLAIFECTQGQAKQITGKYMGGSNEFNKGPDRDKRPEGNVTYNAWRGKGTDGYCWPNHGSAVDPASIIGLFRIRTGNNDGFDMPTEAEWEYAARAGYTDAWGGDGLKTDEFGIMAAGPTSNSTNTLLTTRARYVYNGGYIDDGHGNLTFPGYAYEGTDHGTAIVGSYEPNPWGFYDMQGNVRECTLDLFDAGNDSTDKIDPMGKVVQPTVDNTNSVIRCARGGHWDQEAQCLAFPYRNASDKHRANYSIQGCRFAWHFPYAPKLP